MRKIFVDISNFIAAAFAFAAAITWISSGILGEFSLGGSNTEKALTAASNAAKLNTTAAWCALFSSIFVMASSMISMWPGSTEKPDLDDLINKKINNPTTKIKNDSPSKPLTESDKPVSVLLGISLLVVLLAVLKSKKS